MLNDIRSEGAEEYRRLYRTARWRGLREQQLACRPLCQWCLELEIVEPATEVHHLVARIAATSFRSGQGLFSAPAV
ncbi:hypothetical protein NXT3_PB00398 (plasmid) [Sinorhizobium fredii]|uniref:Uncharacterized protein n=1 Tax=Rhizobium fredii TaxID=380 RepID=A0A2L0HC40_RHIFR|nr:hypothetical protein NXT3_PB00398 [Sinorhizobium fredii]